MILLTTFKLKNIRERKKKIACHVILKVPYFKNSNSVTKSEKEYTY